MCLIVTDTTDDLDCKTSFTKDSQNMLPKGVAIAGDTANEDDIHLLLEFPLDCHPDLAQAATARLPLLERGSGQVLHALPWIGQVRHDAHAEVQIPHGQ